MILQALYALAEREGLMDDPDFESKPVRWLIRVDENGKLVGQPQDTQFTPQAEGNKKPRPIAKAFRVPREQPRTSGDRAFFLFDKAEYVLGADPDGGRAAEKLAVRRDLFREKVHACAEQTHDAGVTAVDRFLTDLATGEQTMDLPEGCAGNDLFAFVYTPDVDILVTDRPKVREYWFRMRAAEGGDASTRCLVSGEMCVPGDLFPPLKKVPGGSTSGVALVSFNCRAFESYGWSGNENAPVSREAAEACGTALNRLLDPRFPRPSNPAETLAPRNIRLSADTVVCYWAAANEAEDWSNSFPGLVEADEGRVAALYQSIWKGQAPETDDMTAFYALTLTGTQGRAIVRDWFESTVGEVQKHLATYFEDLDIVRNAPAPKGKEHPPAFPVRTLLEALADPARNRGEGVPAPLAARLLESAYSGKPYPLAVLQRSLGRFRLEIGREQDDRDGWNIKQWNDARAALIKAVLRRNRHMEVTRDMDPTNKQRGYLLGRLMAVVERIQQMAQGKDLNATVIDRYFGAASATPATVFPRLLRNTRNHIHKLKTDKKERVAIYYDLMLDDIMDGLKEFPSFIQLDEQGLFVLGYHHQRKWLWTKKEDRDALSNGDEETA